MSDSFIFQLSEKIRYSGDGNPDCETATLEFRQPTMREFDELTGLKQVVTSCIKDVSMGEKKNSESEEIEDKGNDEESDNPTGSDLEMVFFSSKNIPFTSISKKFRALSKKTGTFDGKIPITDNTYNTRIKLEDYIRLVCEYVSFFITPSIFSSEGESEQEMTGDI